MLYLAPFRHNTSVTDDGRTDGPTTTTTKGRPVSLAVGPKMLSFF